MKKYIVLIFLFLLCLSLVGCSSTKNNLIDDDDETSSYDEDYEYDEYTEDEIY